MPGAAEDDNIPRARRAMMVRSWSPDEIDAANGVQASDEISEGFERSLEEVPQAMKCERRCPG
jgi:hypothetical protein